MIFSLTFSRIKSILKVLCHGLGWLFLFALLVVAIHLKSPYLFAYRPYETPFLLLIACVLIPFCFLKLRHIRRVISLTLLLAVVVFTLWGEGAFQYRRSVVMRVDAAVADRLGQHFIVGYVDVHALQPLVSKGLIGGIFVTRRNTEGKSFETLQQEIAALQRLRADAGLRPLIVATDQEGGIVSHLSPPLERMPPLSSVIDNSDTQEALLANAQAYGERQGRSLAVLGVSVNFSPVVDLKLEHTSNWLDFHSMISQRAISADPAMTTAVAGVYVKGLQSQGVLATLKHFPGLGRVTSDTHHFSARLDVAADELQRSDWVPFREIARQNDVLLMVGHVILSQVDQKNPASFSKEVIQGIVRNGWQHNGILITDDLTMRAAYSHGFCHVTVSALNAGVDLLLVSYDYEKYYEMMFCAIQAYESGSLDKDMLQRSDARLRRLWP
jgi:beta-N-acetylhexosaminidase